MRTPRSAGSTSLYQWHGTVARSWRGRGTVVATSAHGLFRAIRNGNWHVGLVMRFGDYCAYVRLRGAFKRTALRSEQLSHPASGNALNSTSPHYHALCNPKHGVTQRTLYFSVEYRRVSHSRALYTTCLSLFRKARIVYKHQSIIWRCAPISVVLPIVLRKLDFHLLRVFGNVLSQ